MAIHNKTTDKKICIKICGNTHDSLQQAHENKISINLPKNVLKLFHINHICKRSQSKGVFLLLKSARIFLQTATLFIIFCSEPLPPMTLSLVHPCSFLGPLFMTPADGNAPQICSFRDLSLFQTSSDPHVRPFFLHKNNFEDRMFTCSLIYTSHPLTGPVLKR